MKRMRIYGLIVCASGLLVAQSVLSQGTVYISNLAQPSSGSVAVGSDLWVAHEFITGSNPGGYILDSVQLAMQPASGAPNSFSVMLYGNGAPYLGAAPGKTSLGTLTGSSMDPITTGLYTYTASGLTLAPSQAYFIVATAGTPLASGAFAWSVENTSYPSSSGGWGTTVLAFTSSDGLTWNSPVADDLQFSLTATDVPEPDTVVLLGLPGVLFFAWRRWRASAQAR